MARLSASSLTLIAALALMGGCDRESAPDKQPQEAAAGAEAPAGEEASAGAETPASAEAAAGAEAPEPRKAVSREFAGAALPAFTATSADGKTLNLASLKGRPVILNLWATWCAPCKAEMPVLDRIAGANAGRLRLVTVSEDGKDGAEKVAAFFAGGKFAHLEQWLDPKSDLSFSMNVGEMPTTFIYDASGKEIARVIGAFDWEGKEARALIAEAIGG